MPLTLYEANIILALQALENNKNLSIRVAAKTYNVTHTILIKQCRGRPAQCDIPANSKKLTELEKKTIVQYIIKLSIYSFPPRLSNVKDMANNLLCICNTSPVSKLWAYNFVRRQPELHTRYSRRYDYQRALYKDPKVISNWFRLIWNVKAKYGILDDDIYNFDKTGFMIGIIFPGMVVMTSEGCGKAKLSQPGNRKWATVIQGVNALGWAIPPFIILATQYHLANWYEEGSLPADWRIATTSNGWTTNEVGLD